MAVGLVVVDALATSILTWAFVQSMLATLDASPSAVSQAQGSVTFVTPAMFLGHVAGYLLVGAVFHAILRLADTDRGFGRTLAVVGESAVVSLVFLPLRALGLFLLLDRVPSNPEPALEFVGGLQTESSLLLAAALVAALWQAVVQGYGLARVHDKPADDLVFAAIVVGLVGLGVGLV